MVVLAVPTYPGTFLWHVKPSRHTRNAINFSKIFTSGVYAKPMLPYKHDMIRQA